MEKQQLFIFGGLFLPPTSLKILAIAMPALFALSEKKIVSPKNGNLFLFHS
ncbi:MAG: hypothetical protein ACJA01_002705 [Saprospiraceae bacterium]|jgi:hypothetical protein